MHDLIDRQAAIDAIEPTLKSILMGNSFKAINVIDKIRNLPSAQPEQTFLTNDDIETIRIHLGAFKEKLCNQKRWNEAEEYEKIIKKLLSVPSAQAVRKWIPCSEKRLPEEKDAGILKKLGTNKRSDYVLATVEVKNERMTVTACTYDGVWHWDKKYAFPDYRVIAWMPLPEPYREDEAE